MFHCYWLTGYWLLAIGYWQEVCDSKNISEARQRPLSLAKGFGLCKKYSEIYAGNARAGGPCPYEQRTHTDWET